MKLDHPRDACFKHCAGGFGTRDTPTLDERRSRGPISLHNAIRCVAVRKHVFAYLGLGRARPGLGAIVETRGRMRQLSALPYWLVKIYRSIRIKVLANQVLAGSNSLQPSSPREPHRTTTSVKVGTICVDVVSNTRKPEIPTRSVTMPMARIAVRRIAAGSFAPTRSRGFHQRARRRRLWRFRCPR
jgi:hypothetical protein